MCLSLIQENIAIHAARFAKNMGLSGKAEQVDIDFIIPVSRDPEFKVACRQLKK